MSKAMESTMSGHIISAQLDTEFLSLDTTLTLSDRCSGCVHFRAGNLLASRPPLSFSMPCLPLSIATMCPSLS